MVLCKRCGCKDIATCEAGCLDGVCSVCVGKIKRVEEEEAANIIEKRKPLGMFYLRSRDSVTTKRVYVGIDNWDGNAWTEEFKSLGACKRWLLKG